MELMLVKSVYIYGEKVARCPLQCPHDIGLSGLPPILTCNTIISNLFYSKRVDNDLYKYVEQEIITTQWNLRISYINVFFLQNWINILRKSKSLVLLISTSHFNIETVFKILLIPLSQNIRHFDSPK
jgi:hypothetical protein